MQKNVCRGTMTGMCMTMGMCIISRVLLPNL